MDESFHRAGPRRHFVLPLGRKARQPYAPVLSVAVHLAVVFFLVKYGSPLTDYHDTSTWSSLDPGSAGPIRAYSIPFSTANGSSESDAESSPTPEPPKPKVSPPIERPDLEVLTVNEVLSVTSESSGTDATVQGDSGAAADTGNGGNGGSSGSGSGTGSGNGSGEGKGSGSSKARAPDPKQFIVPPADRPAALRGTTIEVTFMVSAAGKVDKVSLTPEPQDTKFRGRLEAILMGYRFRPARDSTGTSVAGTFTIRLTL